MADHSDHAVGAAGLTVGSAQRRIGRVTELQQLTDAELLTLAGLSRLMVRIDGRFTPEERRALAEIGESVAARPNQAAENGPYRDHAPNLEPLGADAFFVLVERAAREFPDDQAIVTAARAVGRSEARAAIHALLHRIAVANPAGIGELRFLDWLAQEWQLAEARS
jgi:hypothetical protein